MDQLVDEAGFRKIDAARRRVGHLHGVAGRARQRNDRLARATPWKPRRSPGCCCSGRCSTPPTASPTGGPPRGRTCRRMAFDWERQHAVLAVDHLSVLDHQRLLRAVAVPGAQPAHARPARPAAGLAAQVDRRAAASCCGRCTSASGSRRSTGAPALLFNALRGFDQPFNQAPSLHIALAVILWDWYRQFIPAALGAAGAARVGLRRSAPRC